jgi:enoyl-CoA hydratase/carnithine racemase
MAVVEVENRAGVCHIVLNRPEKRNALNAELVLAFAEAVEQAAADPALRCVVVRGEGPTFSSGMDFGDLAALATNPDGLRQLRSRILAAWNLLEEMPKPTIAQIHGGCLGGAFELALACDLRTVAADAVLGLLETRVGLIPDLGGCARLPAVVGVGRAKELIMTSKLISGEEAFRIGLANRVAPAEELAQVTEQLVRELLACSPTAVGRAKRVIDQAARPSLAAALEHEVAVQELCARSPEFADGVRALAERRQPDFTPPGH